MKKKIKKIQNKQNQCANLPMYLRGLPAFTCLVTCFLRTQVISFSRSCSSNPIFGRPTDTPFLGLPGGWSLGRSLNLLLTVLATFLITFLTSSSSFFQISFICW